VNATSGIGGDAHLLSAAIDQGGRATILLDGVRLKGVRAIRFRAGWDEITEVELTLSVTADVDLSDLTARDIRVRRVWLPAIQMRWWWRLRRAVLRACWRAGAPR